MEQKIGNDNIIPATVHYIWFGDNPKSELIHRCIASWKKFLPDWEFIEWNEANYDVRKSQYIYEAYRAKKYAFAADYARFDILYNYGGVYFDTDVELLKPIPESFLESEGFSAVESNKKIAPGLVFAVRPFNSIVGEIIDVYNHEHFIVKDKMNQKTVVQYTTEIFKKYGFILNGETQDVEGIRLYSQEYFCAYDFDVREFQITEKTISIHHYTCTWGDSKNKKILELKMKIKGLIGVKNYRKLLRIKRKLFGVRSQ